MTSSKLFVGYLQFINYISSILKLGPRVQIMNTIYINSIRLTLESVSQHEAALVCLLVLSFQYDIFAYNMITSILYA